MNDFTHIKQLLDSSSGKQMKDYLIMKTLELRDIENIKEFQTNATQTLELKAQLRAYKKLKEIMDAILTFETDTKVKDERDDYSVL